MDRARRDNMPSQLLDKEQSSWMNSHRRFIDVIESMRQQKVVPNEHFGMGAKVFPPHLAYQRFRALHMIGTQSLDRRSFAAGVRIVIVHHHLATGATSIGGAGRMPTRRND